MSYSNNYAYLNGNLRFCENELKVSDVERKMVLTPWSSPTTPFENLKKTLPLSFTANFQEGMS